MMDLVTFRGIATGWTWVDTSTPLLPEVVPDIDANSVSFYSGGGGSGIGHGLKNEANLPNLGNLGTKR